MQAAAFEVRGGAVEVNIPKTVSGHDLQQRYTSRDGKQHEFTLSFPALVHEGAANFRFSSLGQDWRLSVAPDKSGFAATVRSPQGAKTYSFDYGLKEVNLAVNGAGNIVGDDGLSLTRAVILRADKGMVPCSAWVIGKKSLSFTCDDSKLPASAYPYLIDPVLTPPVDNLQSCQVCYWGACSSVCTPGSYGSANEDDHSARLHASATWSMDTSSIPASATVNSVLVSMATGPWFGGSNYGYTVTGAGGTVMGSCWNPNVCNNVAAPVNSIVKGGVTNLTGDCNTCGGSWNPETGDAGYGAGYLTSFSMSVHYTAPSITVQTVIPGLAFAVDGTVYTSAQQFQWTPGSTHTIAINTLTQPGTAGTQYVWSNWSDGGAASHTVTAPAAATTYTAAFATEYMLTTAVSPAGAGALSPASGWQNAGAAVALTATPNSGYRFASYTGDATVSPVTMNGPKSVTAQFTPVGGASWYSPNWSNRRKITIDHTKVMGASPLGNFPVLVSIVNDADLKTVANGGKVGSAGGLDFVFAGADGVTKLNHEIEAYDGVTGTLTAWVQAPSVSPLAATLLHLYYGNAAAADQQNPAAVWDANYKGVWHLKENPAGSPPQFADSTANGVHLTVSTTGGSPGTVSGAAGDPAVNFPANNQYVGTRAASAGPSGIGTGGRTLSGWFSFNSFLGYDGGVNRFAGVNTAAMQADTGDAFLIDGANTFRYAIGSGWSEYVTPASAPVTAGTWHHLAGTYDGAKLRLYVDGQLRGFTDQAGLSLLNAPVQFNLFRYSDLRLNEFRVSNMVRSAEWIGTEYNNQNSPQTFYVLGSSETGGSPPVVAPPVFNPAGGTYAAAQQVEITTATPGAAIYYTVDGSTPTPASTLYTGPVTIGSTRTLKAVGHLAGWVDSAVTSALYTINVPPVLSVVKTHTGNFAAGQTGVTYTLRVSNAAGAGLTSGTVTVTDTPQAGLTLVSLSGTGWTCAGSACTRSDALGAGSYYPDITVRADVAPNAVSPVVNSVAVLGGGSAGASHSDSAAVGPVITTTSILPAANVGAAFSATILGAGGMAPYHFVLSGSPLPPGLSLSDAGVISGTPSAAGTYNFQISARNSDLSAVSAAVTFQVAVGPPLNFTLTVPATPTLVPGQNGSALVVIEPAAFDLPVQFVWTNQPFWPAGLTASFLPNPATATTTVNIGTTAATPAGSYALTFTGTSGIITRIGSVMVTVVPPLSIWMTADPSPQRLGGVITFNGHAEGGTPPYQYQWTGAQFGNGPTVAFTPAQAGVPYAQTLTVSDSGGQARSVSANVHAVADPDFGLNAITAAVTAGQSVSVTETIVPLNGFSGSVAFSLPVQSWPAGLIATLGTLTGTSAVINISTTSGTPPGTYIILFDATAGSSTHTSFVSVTVHAVSDFSIYASPSSQATGQGGKATYNVSVNGGHTGPITFSLAGLPTGATAQFEPGTLNSSGAASLTITTSANTPLGNSAVTITGSSGNVSRFSTLFLTVSAPAAAGMISPAPGASLATPVAMFVWDAGAAVSQYQLKIGSASGASDYYFVNTTARSATVALPNVNQPQTIYATLSSLIGGAWQERAYTYRVGVSAPQGTMVASRAPDDPPGGSAVCELYNNGQSRTCSWRLRDINGTGIDATMVTECWVTPSGVSARVAGVRAFDTFDVALTAQASASPGWYSLNCAIGGRTVSSFNDIYVYDGTPVITSVEQLEPDFPGGPFCVRLYGSNFGLRSGALRVCVPGAEPCNTNPAVVDVNLNGCSDSMWTDTEIRALLIPSEAAAGTYDIQAESAGASGTWFMAGPQSQSVSNRKQVQVDPRLPILTVTVNGSRIDPGSTVFIEPNNPPLTIIAKVENATGFVEWQLRSRYQDPGDTVGFDVYSPLGPPAPQAVGSPWSLTLSTGGTVSVLWRLNGGPLNDFTFTVKGTNPSGVAVRAYIGEEPWFLKLIAGNESSYQQFDSNRNPKFGPPHGYGIMQTDPSPTIDLLYNWKANVDEGRARNAANFAASDAFWRSQLEQWLEWNTENPNTPIGLPEDQLEALCTFSSEDPVPTGKRTFRDAIWIKRYNGAGRPDGGDYISWRVDGGWKISNLNRNNLNYVARVCGVTF